MVDGPEAPAAGAHLEWARVEPRLGNLRARRLSAQFHQDRVGGSTPARYEERSFGVAYRPARSDRVEGLARWTSRETARFLGAGDRTPHRDHARRDCAGGPAGRALPAIRALPAGTRRRSSALVAGRSASRHAVSGETEPIVSRAEIPETRFHSSPLEVSTCRWRPPARRPDTLPVWWRRSEAAPVAEVRGERDPRPAAATVTSGVLPAQFRRSPEA